MDRPTKTPTDKTIIGVRFYEQRRNVLLNLKTINPMMQAQMIRAISETVLK